MDLAGCLFFHTVYQIIEILLAARGLTPSVRSMEPDEDDDHDDAEVLHPASQQSLYVGLWETLALELALCDGRLTEVQRPASSAELREAIEAFQNQARQENAGKAADIPKRIACLYETYKKVDRKLGCEFAAEIAERVRLSFPNPWYEIKQPKDKARQTAKLYPTADFQAQVKSGHVVLPKSPLIAPPQPWGESHGILQGGFHYISLPLYKFSWKNDRVLNFLSAMNEHPETYTEIFEALNRLQDTSWKINQDVWQIVEALLSFAPKTSFRNPNVYNCPKTSRKVKALWKARVEKELCTFRDKGNDAHGPGDRISLPAAREAIRDGSAHKRFYFAYHADARGRIYPVSSILTPHNDDLGRALLEFAEAKQLDWKGAWYLAIHGSQFVATEKISSDGTMPTLMERFDWISAHCSNIRASAEAPLENDWWFREAKEPFGFLAFCMAWHRCLVNLENKKPALCSLPIFVDGSSNGLQHIAAITGSRRLAEVTNVLPGDGARPRDIYMEVIQKVINVCKTSAGTSGKRNRNTMLRAKVWAFADAGYLTLDRQLAKSVVMTIPYGAGAKRHAKTIGEEILNRLRRNEMLEQAGRWLAKQGFLRKPKSGAPYSKLVEKWLANGIQQTIAKTFHEVLTSDYPEIEQFKLNLVNVAEAVTRQGFTLMWVSPSGFPVFERAFKQKDIEIDIENTSKRFRRIYGSRTRRIKCNLKSLTENVDPIKQKTKILADFVQSMDAAHLVKTVNLAGTDGVTHFAVIHDGFATHASDVSRLNRALREAFVRLYPTAVSRLEEFERWCAHLAKCKNPLRATPAEQALIELAADWQANQTAPAAAGELFEPASRPTPEWIIGVRNSPYFFS